MRRARCGPPLEFVRPFGLPEGTANLRRHATAGERLIDRFERDERALLLPLANSPYRRLGLPPE